MNIPQVASCGSWKSPITSDLIVSQTIGIGSVSVEDDRIFWLEKRPQEQGRNLLVSYEAEGEVKNFTPAPLSVRSKIHEYGGGAFVVQQNTIYFSNYQDGRIYHQIIGTKPYPLTEALDRRYGDLIVDRQRNRLICISEDHSQNTEAVNNIISINISTGRIENLVTDSDFYSSPRLSPDGKYLAWLSWNHPHMPWDSTYLWLGKLSEDGLVLESELIAGEESESICEPKWGKDGTLYFASESHKLVESLSAQNRWCGRNFASKVSRICLSSLGIWFIYLYSRGRASSLRLFCRWFLVFGRDRS